MADPDISHLRHVGVVGFGLMGSSISQCLVEHGFRVTACDVSEEAIAKGRRAIARTQALMMRHGLLTPDQVEAANARLRTSTAMNELAGVDLAIEAAAEDLKLKREILARLEDLLPSRTLIATTTSGLPITQIAARAAHPGRFAGLHFGYPVSLGYFLEVIPGEKTAPETLKTCLAFGKACGLDPSLLKRDIPGFLANRASYALFRECLHLVEQGVADPEDIDRALRYDLGPWLSAGGPFLLMDLGGVDLYAKVMETLLPELSAETAVPGPIAAVVRERERSGEPHSGFYRYREPETEKERERVEEFFIKMCLLMREER